MLNRVISLNARTIAWSEIEVKLIFITRSITCRNKSRNYLIIILLRRINNVNRITLSNSKRDHD